MRSGSAKTPVVTELNRGLDAAKKRLREAHEQAIGKQQVELDQEIEACLLIAKDGHASIEKKDGARARVKDLQKQAEELARKPPKAPLIAVDGDTTPEALAERMAANSGHVAVIDDEGPLIRNLGGHYSGKTANLSILLKAYDGQVYYPSRITREASSMDRAILSIAISPQPGLVAEMLRNTMMDETGLINRFLVSLPGDLIGKREGRPSTFIDDVPERDDSRLKDWWSKLLDDLAGHDLITGDREQDADKVIDLTRGAWKLHYQLQEEIERRLDPDRDGDLVRITGWASKHVGRVLRIAALLHLASELTTDDRIDEATMMAAIEIGKWSLEHFLHLGKVIGLSDSASRIKEHILGKDMPWATRTEINVEVFKKAATGEQLEVWIGELVQSGEFELVRKPGAGRPTWFIVKTGFRKVEQDAA